MSGFPVAGPIVTALFEYKSQIKQDRLNRFVSLLEDEFIKMDIDLETLKTEENLDLFEGIFKKVAETRSEQKRIGFKNILMHGIRNNDEIDYCEIFSEMLLAITNKELEILIEYKKYLINGKGVLPERQRLKNEKYEVEKKGNLNVKVSEDAPSIYIYKEPQKTVQELDKGIEVANNLLDEYRNNCNADRFGITNDEYKYFLQNLFSKGLLTDDGVGAIGTDAMEIMSLTNFGIRFLSFVNN